MNYFHSLRKEFGLIYKNKTLLSIFSLILLIPCLYAGFLVASYWDPYGKINKLPLALVNSDIGTTADGKKIAIGKDLAKELKDSKDLNITVLSEKKANKGLKDNKYYLVIRIPNNFSENAMSAMDSNPHKAQLEYTANEGYNFAAASIGASVMENINKKLDGNVTKAYTEALLKAQKDLGKGMSKLADGGNKLTDGLGSAKSGGVKLDDGLGQFAKGTVAFNQGMNKLTTGANSAAAGSSKLVAGSEKFDQGLAKIQNGSSQLAQGAQTLNEKSVDIKNGIQHLLNGTTQIYNQVAQGNESVQDKITQMSQSVTGYSDQVVKLNQQIGEFNTNTTQKIEEVKNSIQNNNLDKQQISDLLNSLESQVNQVAQNENGSTQELVNKKDALVQQIQDIGAGQEALSKGLGQLKAGQEQLLSGVRKFTAGQVQLAQGMKGLNEGIIAGQAGSGKLLAGYQSLSNGLNQLATGSGKLDQASTKISDGAGKLHDGSSKLTYGLGKLGTGSGKISDALTTVDDKLKEHNFTVKTAANAIAKPVSLHKNPINHVKKYGDGFAPYALSLGLYVGMFLFTSVFPILEIGSSRTGLSWFFGKLTILLGIGVLQALIVDGLMLLLGVHVENLTRFFLYSILTSWTFCTLLLFIQSAFGHYGRFICMAFLIIQLTSSGGSFPIELLSPFFNHVHPWIPMTYSMIGFRTAISISDHALFIESVKDLLVFMGIGIVLSLSYYVYRFRKHQKQGETKATLHAA